MFFGALLVVPSAHGQVIEEGGFPVKGGGVSGEAFSLSCPPRLYAQAGESVAISCNATGVPEEGVRYRWESFSGDGLRLLSGAQVLAPLFTVSLSGGGEYAYRLTATGPGVYAAAPVTVTVEGASGETVRAPIVQEECDPLRVPDDLGAGCVPWEREPYPFGFGSEEEGGFLFPEGHGLSDRPLGPVRGGGLNRQTPPRLDCPAAVFLEELETGAIECHAWDASGEEYLEYSWEPVGSTTRAYLDNPLLLPEDSPTPSVIAPEAPVYETLESFHSGETTFRYRYHLTATSRATGLSSHEEVEVYVSSSRPSVYCPLEVVVEEGGTVALDCEGVDPLSFRMDYDEEGASVWWEWEGLWGTSTAPLAETHLSSPLFTAPAGSAGEEYHYIASMTTSASGVPRTARRRVTVTVSEAGTGAPIASDGIRLNNGQQSLPPSLDCEKDTVYEGAPDIMLDCEVTGGSSGTQWTWTWEGIGNTPNTNQLIAGTDSGTPTFRPPNVTGDKKYSYKVTVDGFDAGVNVVLIKAATLVTVKERPDISVTCEDDSYTVDEGADDIEFDCEADGAPEDDSQYTWSWSPTTHLTSGTDTTATPTFEVPDNVPEDKTWTYTATVSAANADDGTATVTVTVQDIPGIDVECQVNPHGPHYEGSGTEVKIECEVCLPKGSDNRCVPHSKPQSDFRFTWTAKSPTPNTDLLEPKDKADITFSVPDTILGTGSDYLYEYTAKTSADKYPHLAPHYEDFTFRVFNKPDITVRCKDPGSVEEGGEEIELECEAAGAPGNNYKWSWSPTTNLTDPNPDTRNTTTRTFEVPPDVPKDTTWTYTVTASAANAEDGMGTVTVTVRDVPTSLTCTDPDPVYEGEVDKITLNCSVTNEPSGATYSWERRGRTSDTSLLTIGAGTAGLTPTFAVPDDIDEPGGADKTYEYTVTMSATGISDIPADVTVTVLEKPDITCRIESYNGPGSITYYQEGNGSFRMPVCPENDLLPATIPRSNFIYSWTGTSEDLDLLSAPDVHSPTFSIPDNLPGSKEYSYRLQVSAPGENADPRNRVFQIRISDRPDITVTCVDPGSVYEGSGEVELECAADGVPGLPDYTWSWSPTDGLTDHNTATPTFQVPRDVPKDTTWTYTVTATEENGDDGTATVTVTVRDTASDRNNPQITVDCDGERGLTYQGNFEVDEGDDDITLNCRATGAPAGSDYTYAWTPFGDTQDTSLLSETDILSPTFYVPDAVDRYTAYTYTLTVTAANAEDGAANVIVNVYDANSPVPAVTCSDIEIYEGTAAFPLDCSVVNEPPGATYAWAARGSTTDTDRLSSTTMLRPTFSVPHDVDVSTNYEYRLTLSASGINDVTEDVTVSVKNKLPLALVCTPPDPVYEGSSDITLECEASGAPSGSGYAYVWTAQGDTQYTSLLSSTTIAKPTFAVPEEVASDETYEYTLTVSADNAQDATANVRVRVLDKKPLNVACATPSAVYEGSADFALDCAATGAPAGFGYAYVWTARGDTQDTSLLSSTTVKDPTFAVPDEVDEDETYEYLLTVSAENAIDATAEVTVRVLKFGSIALICATPPLVYEGSEDFDLDCSISGDAGGTNYTYAWTARGNTQDTSLLSAADIASPTFYVPDEIAATTAYEYLLTANADNAEEAPAEVTVTVLNKDALAVTCADPVSAHEGAEDIAFDCTASGAPAGSNYTYAWTARGNTLDTSLLSTTNVASPTFYVPDQVDSDETYTYRLTVSTSAGNIDPGTFDLTVNVYDSADLVVVCTDRKVYEGAPPFGLQCTASGGPPGMLREWDWSPDTHLTGPRIRTPVFTVPADVESDMTFTYTATVTAGSMVATGALTVTVLNKEALSVACTDAYEAYEGSEDITLDCSASGAPGDNPQYTYAWTANGDTQNTSLLSAVDIASPVFSVPGEVDEDETYEYLLTVSAENAEDASAEVTVTVLNRAVAPPSEPVSPPVEEPPVEEPPVDSPPLASSPARAPSGPSALGVTISASALRFGVQSSETQVSLDPMTDGISTHVSGPYHAGRMTLSPGGSEEIHENGEMDLSIELASPVLLKRADAIEAASIVLLPQWSFAESCEQLSSQAIGSLYTEVTLSEDACRLLRFGGELDLTDVPSGQYTGSMDLVLRSGEREETHSVDVDVAVIPAQQVITIGPRGVRFSTSRELPAGLTEEQSLSIYPHVAFLTEEKPHGVFELSNPSLIPLEISVSARFGYTEATENGREVVVEDVSDSPLGDLSEVVDIRPGVLILQPGEKGLVRYGLQEGALAAMAEKGYAAFFDVVSEPRQYVRSDRMPEEVTGERTARVTMRVPGVYVPGEGASQLRAALLSISYVGSMSATFLLETSDHPFAGEVVAYDGDGRELGRRETLVYTRSRVRVPLDRIPEEGAVFLRFEPRGSDRAPEPASVEWNAPPGYIGGDIGAAGKDGTRLPATLVQKP